MIRRKKKMQTQNFFLFMCSLCNVLESWIADFSPISLTEGLRLRPSWHASKVQQFFFHVFARNSMCSLETAGASSYMSFKIANYDTSAEFFSQAS